VHQRVNFSSLIPHLGQQRRVLLFSVLALSLTVWQPVFAAITPEKAAKQRWHRVTTPNFELITDLSEKNAVELVEQVEKFRQFVMIISPIGPDIQIRPVTIFATKRRASFEFFTNDSEWLNKMAGFFSDTVPATYATVKLKGRHLARNNLHVYYHEYVHYLAATSMTYDLPHWFNEGFADYLASTEFVGKKKVNYAKPMLGHLQKLYNSNWVHVRDILAERRGQYKSINRIRKTYAQGYYLTHYFYAENERRKSLLEFIDLRNNGVALNDASQQAFGMSLDELNTAVKKYVRTPDKMRYLSIELKKPLELKEFSVQQLEPADLLAEFGLYAWRSNHGADKANAWFKHALTLKPDHARALAGLAQTHLASNFDQAYNYLERAKQLAPNDPYVATVQGHVYRRLVNQNAKQENDPEKHQQYWRQAVQGYNTAINSGTINVEALLGAARLYTGHQPESKVVELLKFAYQFAPKNITVQNQLIQGLLRNQEADNADLIAGIVRNNPHMADAQRAKFEDWYQDLRQTYLVDQTESTQAMQPQAEPSE
jgi:hypothetical protein